MPATRLNFNRRTGQHNIVDMTFEDSFSNFFLRWTTFHKTGEMRFAYLFFFLSPAAILLSLSVNVARARQKLHHITTYVTGKWLLHLRTSSTVKQFIHFPTNKTANYLYYCNRWMIAKKRTIKITRCRFDPVNLVKQSIDEAKRDKFHVFFSNRGVVNEI